MAAETSEELAIVLEDLERHLAWQLGSGAKEIFDVHAARAQAVARADARPAPTARPAPARPGPAPMDRFSQQAIVRDAPAPTAEPIHRPWMKSPPAPVAPPVPAPASQDPGERRTLDEIRREMGDCRRCKLSQSRQQLVFGAGNPRAQLVFVGEAPGAEEDARGVPFVGEAGQLLTKMIEAMGFSRDEVYLCNVVKSRPPDNRTPEPDEIAACLPFLRAQLASIQPKVIVALGKVASHALLGETTPIGQLRGIWKQLDGIALMPTFHPAYLVRRPDEKKKVWSDLRQVMKVFGKEPASGGGR